MDMPIQWSPGVTIEMIEKQVILMAFRFYRGNKTTTANALGISIRTLDNKLEKYEMDGQSEKERFDSEKQRRDDFLARQRTGHVAAERVANERANPDQSPSKLLSNPRLRVESAAQSAEKPGVSLPERKEVQGVLPGQFAQGGAKKAR